jgi:hypothetical protein
MSLYSSPVHIPDSMMNIVAAVHIVPETSNKFGENSGLTSFFMCPQKEKSGKIVSRNELTK